MCGRYGFIPKKEFFERFGVEEIDLEPNTNTSPGQIMPVITMNPQPSSGKLKTLAMLKWGASPFLGERPQNRI